jgi:hypothetical protein
MKEYISPDQHMTYIVYGDEISGKDRRIYNNLSAKIVTRSNLG